VEREKGMELLLSFSKRNQTTGGFTRKELDRTYVSGKLRMASVLGGKNILIKYLSFLNGQWPGEGRARADPVSCKAYGAQINRK